MVSKKIAEKIVNDSIKSGSISVQSESTANRGMTYNEFVILIENVLDEKDIEKKI